MQGARAFNTDEYKYGFNGKENDNETGTQDYGMRIYNPALGKFLSVDPLYQSYPWNSTYAFCENRPIDGIDLDGGEWKSKHKWSDAIQDESLIKKLGDGYVKGMTYQQAWGLRAGAILDKSIGVKRDCFNTAVRAVIEFAAVYGLPFNIKDHKKADENGKSDPTFDNDNYGYTNKAGEKVQFKEGDWEALANAVGDYYGAADAYGNPNLVTSQPDDKWSGGILVLTKTHILTIVNVNKGTFWDDIEYTQGSLEDGKATAVEKKSLSKIEMNVRMYGGKHGIWNFKAFDRAQFGEGKGTARPADEGDESIKVMPDKGKATPIDKTNN